LVLAAWCGLLPGEARAQASILEGLVRDTAGSAIVGAEVVNLTTRQMTATSATGEFRITDLPAGPQLWIVRAIGYRPERLALTVEVADTFAIEVVLGAVPQVLPDLVVEVRGHRYQGRLAEVARRALASAAPASAFIGPEELERWAKFDLGDVLRRAGLAITGNFASCPRSGPGLTARRRPGVAIWLDVALVDEAPAFDVRTFPTAWFAAIEVYRSAIERPMQFDSPGSACTILLWTR
jgi:hypothetical protein